MILKDAINRMVDGVWMTLVIQGNGQMIKSSMDELGPVGVSPSRDVKSSAFLAALLNDMLSAQPTGIYVQVCKSRGGYRLRRVYMQEKSEGQ